MPRFDLNKTCNFRETDKDSRAKWTFANPLELAGTFGAALGLKTKTAQITLSTAGLTHDEASWIPAGALVLGCVGIVTTAITGASGTLSLGSSSLTTLWCNAKSSKLTVGATINSFTEGSGTAPNIFLTAGTLRFTSGTGNFSGGVVRVTIFYFDLTAHTA